LCYTRKIKPLPANVDPTPQRTADPGRRAMFYISFTLITETSQVWRSAFLRRIEHFRASA